MLDKYNRIIAKLNEARTNGNSSQVKQWRIKLQQWQQEYGACAPIQ